MMSRSLGGYIFPAVKAETRNLGSWITFITPFHMTHHLIPSPPIYLPQIQVGHDNISSGIVVKKTNKHGDTLLTSFPNYNHSFVHFPLFPHKSKICLHALKTFETMKSQLPLSFVTTFWGNSLYSHVSF